VTIQLRPEELGRIEIKLEMSQDGKVRAAITADNPATLELLQRDARGLERALQDAGLRADASNLEFNLRGEGHDRLSENDQARDHRGQGPGGAHGQADSEAQDEDTYDYQLAARLRGGIDTYA
jgi:flagellar hook-length control protein FliK